MKIHLKRLDDAFHFEASNEDGRTVHMDAAEKIGGRNQGVRPMQMLLMGLAGCSAIDIVSILKKQKQQIDDFQIETEGERENIPGDGAKIFTDIQLHFILKGIIDGQKAKRAVELSVDKYCSVGKTLNLAGAKITYKISLNGNLIS
jgi:putative redox protein